MSKTHRGTPQQVLARTVLDRTALPNLAVTVLRPAKDR